MQTEGERSSDSDDLKSFSVDTHETAFSQRKKRRKYTCFTKCSYISSYTTKTISILDMTGSESAVMRTWYVTFHAINSRFTTTYRIKI